MPARCTTTTTRTRTETFSPKRTRKATSSLATTTNPTAPQCWAWETLRTGRYSGHVSDPETGLIYIQARYHDPEVGRFLSVDPDEPKPGNVFNFNRYEYVNNNPIMRVDPTGRVIQIVGDANSRSE